MRRVGVSTRLQVLIPVLAGLAWGCGGAPDPESGAEAAAVAQVVEEVPRPELSALDPLVQTQLRQGREELDLALQRGDLAPEELSKIYGRAAMLYHAYRLTAAAETAYRNAQLLDPRNARWPYYLGHVLYHSGRPDESVKQFERALELRQDDLAALIRLGEIERERDRNERAESFFRRALELDADCVPALEGLGKIALARQQYDAAVQNFERVLALAPLATAVNYPLGLAYRGRGEMERARTLIEKRGNARVTIPDPRMEEIDNLAQSWRILQNRGTTLASAGMYREALEEFRKALAAAPDQASVRINMGAALRHLGDLAGALEAMETAVRLDPGESLAHFNLAVLLAARGEHERAVHHYRQALELNPDYIDAHFNLANALRRLGRFEESIGPYRQVIQRDPGNELARLGEGFALIRIGRYAEARSSLEQGLQAVPESAHLRNALARVLAAAPVDGVRDGARALAVIQPLIERRQDLPDVLALAMALAEYGDYAAAARWQQGAIDAVRQAGRADLLPKLERDHRGYAQRRPCREPWAENDPALTPP